jgi:3-isopropylmalate/(R)-2-methylmalate dehydratase small subunit
MESKLRGKAWVFGDILDVDWEICSFEELRTLQAKGVKPSPESLGPYCMTVVDPEFPKKVQKGDFIVAGENMGYGHDHDHASMSIQGAGVAAVVCDSTRRRTGGGPGTRAAAQPDAGQGIPVHALSAVPAQSHRSRRPV